MYKFIENDNTKNEIKLKIKKKNSCNVKHSWIIYF